MVAILIRGLISGSMCGTLVVGTYSRHGRFILVWAYESGGFLGWQVSSRVHVPSHGVVGGVQHRLLHGRG